MAPEDESTTTPLSQDTRKVFGRPKWQLALIVAAVVAIVVAVAVVICQNRNVPITADVRYNTLFGSGSFTIQNNDDFDWTKVRLTLNKVYVCELDVIPAGETRQAWMSNFKKDDGTAFDAWNTTVKTLYIDCRTPNGKSHTEWMF